MRFWMALLAVLIVGGCEKKKEETSGSSSSSEKSSPSIVGRWIFMRDGKDLEEGVDFRADGTMNIFGRGGKTEKSGKYHWLDDKKIQLDPGDGGGSDKEKIVFYVIRSGDDLVLDGEGKTTRLRRTGDPGAPPSESDLAAAGMSANERNASASLKTVCTAEADFRSNDRDANGINDFWVDDVRGLYSILGGGTEGIKLIDIAIAMADSAPHASPALPGVTKPTPKSGYYFRMCIADENGTSYGAGGAQGDSKHNYGKFGVCAYPAEYGKTGKRTYIINENFTMLWKDTGGKPVDKYPSDAEIASGWSKMD